MASAISMVLRSITFAFFWVLAVFPAIPVLPIGRTAGSLLGALLMVVFHVLTADEAYESIDLPILSLLFGTMVVVVYLERADMFKYQGTLLAWKSLGPKDLIFRISMVSGFSSALFTNDTACVALTEFVLKICSQHNLSPFPFLLALASSANIGSSATLIGNPQNLVKAFYSGISFTDFLLGILPAAIFGLLVNALLLLCMYWRSLSSHISDREFASAREVPNVVELEEGLPINGFVDQEAFNVSEARTNCTIESCKRMLWKACVYLIVVGMLISYLMGLNMSWTAIAAALALVALDFKEASPCLEKVSYSLLVFFCGMFITMEGFNKTGIPSAFWNLMEPYAQVDTAIGIAVLAVVVLVLSNLVSNVPTVLLLGTKIVASTEAISKAEEKKAWLILAWASTVAGNLTLLGSAANLIVCEQARRCRSPRLQYDLSFWKHIIFGVPSTLVVTAIGLTLIRG
ncbi:hypothetical protein Ancab_009204 [Ancistrocladus abbreviatus]